MNVITGNILPEFQRLSYAPTNYTPADKTLRGHLAAIDGALNITLADLGGLTASEIDAIIDAAVAEIPGGSDGTDGQDGTNGVDGKSAYEIAVANGFVGTEIDWLASLQATDGTNGTNGTDGTDGTNGVGVPTGGTTGQVLAKTATTDYATAWIDPPASGPAAPSWHGHAHAAYSDGNSQALLERIYTETGNALTASAVTTSIIRLVRFHNPANLTVNCLRAMTSAPYSAGTGFFKFALYNAALEKISPDITMTMGTLAASTWYQMGSALNVFLQANSVYYLALSVTGTNVAEPLRCFSGTNLLTYNAATPSQLSSSTAMTFHTVNTTSGTLPATISSFRATERSGLAGGFPAIFLCNA